MTGAPPPGPADPGAAGADEPSGPASAVAAAPPWADGASGPLGTGLPPVRRPVRRRTRWRAAFFGLAVLATVAGVGWALLGNRLLVVRSVSVTGTHLLAPDQVASAADVRLGTPLLSVNTGAVARRVEAIRQVASATVSRDWPDSLVITVTERVPVMAVKMAGGGYDLVDKTGVVVRYTKTKPDLPVLTTTLSGARLPGSATAAAAAAVLRQLQPWLARQVAAVKPKSVAAGPEQVTLTLRDGKTVVWGSTDNAAQKNRELTIVLKGSARHVDVSAPGTVVTH